MPDPTPQARPPVPADDPGWEDTRDLFRSRVTQLIAETGQRGRPSVVFPRTRTPWATTPDGHKLHSPATYHWHLLDDRLAIDLHSMAGPYPPGRVSDLDSDVDTFDGCLLHELGHRHDRWLARLTIGHYLTVALLIVAAAVILLGEHEGSAPILTWGTLLAVVALAVEGTVRAVNLPLRRWFERRADDYALDRGGITRVRAFMDALINAQAAEPAAASPVHAPTVERKARQEARHARRTTRGVH